MTGLILTALFIGIPALEIYLIIQVGGALGGLYTFGLVVLSAVIGAALAKHQGLAALRRIQTAFTTGKSFGTSLASGAIVLFAAALMVTPGFATDICGLLLLVPLVRAPLARRLARWGENRVKTSMQRVGDLEAMMMDDLDRRSHSDVIDV